MIINSGDNFDFGKKSLRQLSKKYSAFTAKSPNKAWVSTSESPPIVVKDTSMTTKKTLLSVCFHTE